MVNKARRLEYENSDLKTQRDALDKANKDIKQRFAEL